MGCHRLTISVHPQAPMLKSYLQCDGIRKRGLGGGETIRKRGLGGGEAIRKWGLGGGETIRKRGLGGGEAMRVEPSLVGLVP